MFLNIVDPLRPAYRASRTDVLPVAPQFPESLAFSERATMLLREYLDRSGLEHYRIFHRYLLDFEMDEIDEHIAGLGEQASWEPLPAMTQGVAEIARLKLKGDGQAQGQEPGILNLRKHEVVLARWYWFDPVGDNVTEAWLCAAPTVTHYATLYEDLKKLQHKESVADWRIVRGMSPGERVARSNESSSDLLLDPRIRERIDVEVVQFFRPEVAAMYESLRVPYRRGVLMHGPPGNGKTSLIRWIGSQLPKVPGFILRPSAKFDTDHLSTIIRRWTEHAPAILVIEDLDWLLKQVDVSTFLNTIDGVESAATGGLLLIATTNHPEKLDPAINNRPGRFDIVMEIASPDETLRGDYFRKHLPEISTETVTHLAAETEELAFAHLQEIVRMSGLLAINAGRTSRLEGDVLHALRTVRETFDDAARGFRCKLDLPFGLGHLHQKQRSARLKA